MSISCLTPLRAGFHEHVPLKMRKAEAQGGTSASFFCNLKELGWMFSQHSATSPQLGRYVGEGRGSVHTLCPCLTPKNDAPTMSWTWASQFSACPGAQAA